MLAGRRLGENNYLEYVIIHCGVRQVLNARTTNIFLLWGVTSLSDRAIGTGDYDSKETLYEYKEQYSIRFDYN